MAYFQLDLCLYSPGSYSPEEKKEICNDMMATSKAMLDAMREDFEQLPPDARARLQFVGDGDPLYRGLEPLS